eukprot:Clim_evm19s159 gene=Clim_evmTU19s159
MLRSRSPSPLTSKKVLISGLSANVTSDHIEEIVNNYGKVLKVELIHDKVSGKSMGRAFVVFADLEAAEQACDYLNGAQIDGVRSACRLVFSAGPPNRTGAGFQAGGRKFRNRRGRGGKGTRRGGRGGMIRRRANEKGR